MKKAKKTILWILNVVAYVIVATILISSLQGYKVDISLKNIDIQETGGVVVGVDPAEVTATVDGETGEFTKTPFIFTNVRTGYVPVTVSADEYYDASFDVVVEATLMSQVFNMILSPLEWQHFYVLGAGEERWVHQNQPFVATFDNDEITATYFEDETVTTEQIGTFTNIITAKWHPYEKVFWIVHMVRDKPFITIQHFDSDDTYGIALPAVPKHIEYFPYTRTIYAQMGTDIFYKYDIEEVARWVQSKQAIPDPLFMNNGMYYVRDSAVIFKHWGEESEIIGHVFEENEWQKHNNFTTRSMYEGLLVVTEGNHHVIQGFADISRFTKKYETTLIVRNGKLFILRDESFAGHGGFTGDISSLFMLNEEYFVLKDEAGLQMCRVTPFYCTPIPLTGEGILPFTENSFVQLDTRVGRILFYRL